MRLNPTFISNIQDLHGEAGQSWLTDLPTQLNQLCEKHGLRFVKAMPNLSYHFVGLVVIVATGKIAIIKMAPTLQTIETEAKWLQCFDKGAPQVYWFDETYHAFLMENLAPGKPLTSLVGTDDDGATRVICKTILDLQSHQQTQLECKHLSELANSFSALEGRIDAKLLSKAASLFQDLTRDRTHDVLLHGDLHHDNILSSGLGWKVIDPHGYKGDPAFEVGAMIYNPRDAFPIYRTLPQTIERRLKILGEELPFDKERIKAWTFCMTMLSIAWTVEDHAQVPEHELMIAQLIDGL